MVKFAKKYLLVSYALTQSCKTDGDNSTYILISINFQHFTQQLKLFFKLKVLFEKLSRI